MEDKSCPYCNTELIEGDIYGDRYSLKWLPKHQSLLMGIWVKGGQVISKKSNLFMSRPKTKSYKCFSCNKIIIDLDEL